MKDIFDDILKQHSNIKEYIDDKIEQENMLDKYIEHMFTGTPKRNPFEEILEAETKQEKQKRIAQQKQKAAADAEADPNWDGSTTAISREMEKQNNEMSAKTQEVMQTVVDTGDTQRAEKDMLKQLLIVLLKAITSVTKKTTFTNIIQNAQDLINNKAQDLLDHEYDKALKNVLRLKNQKTLGSANKPQIANEAENPTTDPTELLNQVQTNLNKLKEDIKNLPLNHWLEILKRMTNDPTKEKEITDALSKMINTHEIDVIKALQNIDLENAKPEEKEFTTLIVKLLKTQLIEVLKQDPKMNDEDKKNLNALSTEELLSKIIGKQIESQELNQKPAEIYKSLLSETNIDDVIKITHKAIAPIIPKILEGIERGLDELGQSDVMKKGKIQKAKTAMHAYIIVESYLQALQILAADQRGNSGKRISMEEITNIALSYINEMDAPTIDPATPEKVTTPEAPVKEPETKWTKEDITIMKAGENPTNYKKALTLLANYPKIPIFTNQGLAGLTSYNELPTIVNSPNFKLEKASTVLPSTLPGVLKTLFNPDRVKKIATKIASVYGIKQSFGAKMGTKVANVLKTRTDNIEAEKEASKATVEEKK
jgi:hypothetical protein